MLPVPDKASQALTAADRRQGVRPVRAVPPARTETRTAEHAPGMTAAARVAEELRESCADDVVLLHHRAAPRGAKRFDHLVVAPTGVWIVHSRRNQGRVATRRPLFGGPRLTIGGRERMDLLASLARQTDHVRDAIAPVLAAGAVPIEVRSALCFVDTAAPLTRTLYLGSYLFYGAPSLASHLNADGPHRPEAITAIAAALEAAFPAA